MLLRNLQDLGTKYKVILMIIHFMVALSFSQFDDLAFDSFFVNEPFFDFFLLFGFLFISCGSSDDLSTNVDRH